MKTNRKPEITQSIIDRWQKKVNLMAQIIKVPAGLIMKVHPTEIEVFVRSQTPGNPYQTGDREELNIGLYCETVMATRRMLEVSNALEDEQWKDNPDIKLGMISYLGVPLLYPDGDLFGTVCILDSDAREYSSLQKQILNHFKESCEDDLTMQSNNLAIDKALDDLRNCQKESGKSFS